MTLLSIRAYYLFRGDQRKLKVKKYYFRSRKISFLFRLCLGRRLEFLYSLLVVGSGNCVLFRIHLGNVIVAVYLF
jgi:hypothetical protein